MIPFVRDRVLRALLRRGELGIFRRALFGPGVEIVEHGDDRTKGTNGDEATGFSVQNSPLPFGLVTHRGWTPGFLLGRPLL